MPAAAGGAAASGKTVRAIAAAGIETPFGDVAFDSNHRTHARLVQPLQKSAGALQAAAARTEQQCDDPCVLLTADTAPKRLQQQLVARRSLRKRVGLHPAGFRIAGVGAKRFLATLCRNGVPTAKVRRAFGRNVEKVSIARRLLQHPQWRSGIARRPGRDAYRNRSIIRSTFPLRIMSPANQRASGEIVKASPFQRAGHPGTLRGAPASLLVKANVARLCFPVIRTFWRNGDHPRTRMAG